MYLQALHDEKIKKLFIDIPMAVFNNDTREIMRHKDLLPKDNKPFFTEVSVYKDGNGIPVQEEATRYYYFKIDINGDDIHLSVSDFVKSTPNTPSMIMCIKNDDVEERVMIYPSSNISDEMLGDEGNEFVHSMMLMKRRRPSSPRNSDENKGARWNVLLSATPPPN